MGKPQIKGGKEHTFHNEIKQATVKGKGTVVLSWVKWGESAHLWAMILTTPPDVKMRRNKTWILMSHFWCSNTTSWRTSLSQKDGYVLSHRAVLKLRSLNSRTTFWNWIDWCPPTANDTKCWTTRSWKAPVICRNLGGGIVWHSLVEAYVPGVMWQSHQCDTDLEKDTECSGQGSPRNLEGCRFFFNEQMGRGSQAFPPWGHPPVAP